MSEICADRSVDIVVNPLDRSDASWGYDVFYELHMLDTPTIQQIVETVQQVVFTLVGRPPDTKDPFWINSARSMGISIFVYAYSYLKITEFVDICAYTLSRPIEETIDEIIVNSKPSSPQYRYAIGFKGMAPETLLSVFAELCNHLYLYCNDQHLIYALKVTPRRCDPTYLTPAESNGWIARSIYLAIPEEKMSVYSELVRLIITQLLRTVCELRPPNSPPCVLVLEELSRVLSDVPLPKLVDSIKTARSRNVAIWTVCQSIEGLTQSLGGGSAGELLTADLIANSEFVLLMSAKTPKTIKLFSELCGKFLERRQHWSGYMGHRKVSTSFQETPVYTAKDMMTLQASGDMLLFTPQGFFKIKKSPYYKDSFYMGIVQKIKDKNKIYEEISKCSKK